MDLLDTSDQAGAAITWRNKSSILNKNYFAKMDFRWKTTCFNKCLCFSHVVDNAIMWLKVISKKSKKENVTCNKLPVIQNRFSFRACLCKYGSKIQTLPSHSKWETSVKIQLLHYCVGGSIFTNFGKYQLRILHPNKVNIYFVYKCKG